MVELTGVPARVQGPGPGGRPELPSLPAEAPRRKVLLFRAAGEWFALALDRVREICPRAPITRVPRAPAQVLGVMNLRGRPVVLVDLPHCLGLRTGEADAPHVVLLDLGDPDLAVGVVAERIDQVVEVELRGGEDAGGAEGPELVEAQGRVATLVDPMRALARALPNVAGGGPGVAA